MLNNVPSKTSGNDLTGYTGQLKRKDHNPTTTFLRNLAIYSPMATLRNCPAKLKKTPYLLRKGFFPNWSQQINPLGPRFFPKYNWEKRVNSVKINIITSPPPLNNGGRV